jgi:hypothetical protein
MNMDDNQTPPQVSTPVPAPLSFRQKLEQDLKDIWNTDKVFFVTFGFLILVVKFRDILIGLLVNNSKNVLQTSQDKDKTLSAQEAQANEDANTLVQKAKDEPSQETPVTDDWYKHSD